MGGNTPELELHLIKPLQTPIPGHHLLLLVGGVSAAADRVDGSGQEVQPVVFEVLIHQRQDDLTVT